MDEDLNQTNHAIVDLKTSLKSKKEEIQNLDADYAKAQALAITKQRSVQELKPKFDEHNSKITTLTKQRDDLTYSIANQKRFIQDAEAKLNYTKYQLTKNENLRIEVRKNIDKAKREAKPFWPIWELARNDLMKAESFLKMAIEKLRIAKEEYENINSKLKSIEKVQGVTHQTIITINNQDNQKNDNTPNTPKTSITVYVVASVVIIVVLTVLSAFLSYFFPWPAVLSIFIIAIIIVAMIIVSQLRNDEKLSENRFLKALLKILELPSFLIKKK